jgi:transcriptional regulator with XRE-family HTH domain
VKAVKNLRKRRGWTIQELADASGTSHFTVNDIELGKRNPRGKTLQKIAKALDVPVSALFDEEPTDPKAPAPTSWPEPQATLGDRRIVEQSQDEFRRTLSEAGAAGVEALVELYTRLEGERINAELRFREDEDNRAARADYARAVERRMLLFLTLVGRGVTLDPEQLSNQIEQLEELQLH